MKVIDCEQGSPEWFAARCGRVTASRIADVMARTKSGYGAGRANYMAELIAERLTGQVAESYTSPAMQRGSELEAEAISAYEFMQDVDVSACGFVLHPTIEMSGASPDGLVGDDGLVEVKCPNTSTHIDTLLTGKVPAKYTDQMLWQLVCTGRQWCDFVSYDPRMPSDLSLFVWRYHRGIITREEELYEGVQTFLSDLEAKLAKLQGLRAPEISAENAQIPPTPLEQAIAVAGAK